MAEMQRNGSDIYFGGFKQMKRYPFFYTLSNWFCPFYQEHPGLSNTTSKLKNSKFLDILQKNGPFCDSDKFSFALALATVVDKIPENMRSALNEKETLCFLHTTYTRGLSKTLTYKRLGISYSNAIKQKHWNCY